MSRGNSALASWLSTGGGSGGGGVGTLTFISVTKAQLDALVGASGLVPGSFYKITNRGDQGILVQATSASTITQQGVRYMLCPATYEVTIDGSGNDWIGVWHITKSATVGQLAIWGGLVWRNTTGNIGTSDDVKTLDAADWTVITKASNPNSQYTALQFSVNYDYANDWIDAQWDDNGNIMGLAFPASDPSTNYCDLTDWNMMTMPGVTFAGNVCKGVFNNVTTTDILLNRMAASAISGNLVPSIELNSPTADIADNTCALIRLNSNKGQIAGNAAGNITGNSNNGNIENNTNASGITSNSNNGDISGNTNTAGILNNSNAGSISGNANNGDITGNSNLGDISSNSNGKDISHNSNGGHISGNTNPGFILRNSNAGAISNNLNSNFGHITLNSNNGAISGNVNDGIIFKNGNNGDITDNDPSISEISFNRNNGDIASNNSTGNVNITNNVNNGLITGTFSANVTDPTVNKT